MSNKHTDFIVDAVDRTSQLSRHEFEEKYRFVRPVVATNGATLMPAFDRWSLDYLRTKAGSATVYVANYQSDMRDYDAAVRERTTLDAFIRELADGSNNRCIYLFNNQSCVFARNEQRKELHVGWAREANPGLASLAHDFILPSYVRQEDYILAALVLGSERNATDFHYDHGGEAKLLVQLRGQKRLLLFPPSAASVFGMSSPFETQSPGGSTPNPSRIKTRLRSMTTEQSAALRNAGGLCVDLQPGDVVYWPAFWLHDVTNIDGPNLAIAVFIDEIKLSPLLIRHLVLKVFEDFNTTIQSDHQATTYNLTCAAAQHPNDESGRSLKDLFRLYESFLLSDSCRHLSSLAQWNATCPSFAHPVKDANGKLDGASTKMPA